MALEPEEVDEEPVSTQIREIWEDNFWVNG